MKIDTGIFGESRGEQATMKGKCNWKKNNSKDVTRNIELLERVRNH